jgi:predicted nuclease with TOPRIM domain
MEEIRAGSPVFVKIDEYKDVLEIIGIIKDKIEDARTTLGKINDLKNEEDAELELWNSKLEEIEKKIDFIDTTLFEPSSL